jgi:hypothetical protein
MVTSRASVGQWLRRRGLLLTPEEVAPPAELAELRACLEEAESRSEGTLPLAAREPSVASAVARGMLAEDVDGEATVPVAVPPPAPRVMEPALLQYVGSRRPLERHPLRVVRESTQDAPPPMTPPDPNPARSTLPPAERRVESGGAALQR